MASNLNVAIISLDIAWADRDENLLNTEKLLRKLRQGTDLVVLPELFSTGFVQDHSVFPTLAETLSGPTLTAVSRWSRIFNLAIAGGLLFKHGNKIFNRGFLIDPSGEEYYYDKRHLFSLSAESEVFTQGEEEPFVARYRGWNLSLIVCYDLRFPVWCRNKSHRYDAMLVPANWANSRQYAWSHLLIARAIENQAYYVGANRGGSDDLGKYGGSAMIVDGLGKPISEVDEKTGIIYATLNKDILEEQRRKFPAGRDADDFALCH